MPSQNLPKPNLPGQPTVAPVLTNSSTNAQTVFDQKPNQIRQAQAIPGGLSRENPGGTPPNMKVAAPPLSIPALPEEKQVAEEPLKRPEMPQQPIISRPMGPLNQSSVKTNTANQAAVSLSRPAMVNPVSPTVPMKQTIPTVNQTIKNNAVNSPEMPTISQAQPSQNVASRDVENTNVDKNSAGANKKLFNPLMSLKGKLPKPLLIGGAVLVVILIGLLLFSLFKPKTSTKTNTKATTNSDSAGTSADGATAQITTLTYWGLWEDSQILKEVISDFESKNPSIKIDYRKQSHRDYRERLQQAIASANGPDIFRYHVAWVPMLSSDLSPMPSTVMSTTEYKQIFYPTAYNNLQVGGQIVGIPLMYDGLALFYNKEMLKTANLSVPTTWAELRTAANKLTVPASISERTGGNITRAGLAIGNAGNVDHFSDILALLIIQNGGNPADSSSQYVKDAITFYTNFIKQDKVWSDRLANSTTAFARGDVAMIFAPSWRAHDIKNLNPNLDFAVARVPQLDAQKPAAWATFWAEGVSAKSKNKEAAWAFLKYLSTPEVLRKFYTNASQYRNFGEIYPRTDMASELVSNELVGAYVTDAPIAKSWYMSSFTHDNGVNDQIIKYYEDAINAVLSNTDVAKALETATTGISSVLGKYGSK